MLPVGAAVLALLLSPVAFAQSAAPVEAVWPDARAPRTTVELTGSFTARRAAALSPRVPGLVAAVAVDAGDRVSAGQALVHLDADLAKLEVAQARALLEERQAGLEEAQRLLDEARQLSDDSFLSATEKRSRETEVALARAALSRAGVALDTARERLARHTVVAPFAGTIARKLTEAGEWVETGTPVAELVDADQLWLDVRSPQRHWPDLGGEAAVTVTADALPDRTLDARLHARVPVSDPSARTFLVRLAIPDPGGEITPGMSGRASFRLTGGGQVLYVPRDAVIRYPDGTTTVWTVESPDERPRAREVEVTIQRFDGDEAEIGSGIGPDRPVVVRGNEMLVEGQPVRLLDAAPAPREAGR